MKRPPFVQSIADASFRRGLYTLACGHTVSVRASRSRMGLAVCRPGQVVCVVCLRPWLSGCAPSLFRLRAYRELAALIADEEPPSVGVVRVPVQLPLITEPPHVAA